MSPKLPRKIIAFFVKANVKSDSNAAGRYDLQRLLSDARAHKFDLVLIKSCSRFFRNVVDALTVLHELDDLGIRVRFDEEGLCTEDESFWLYVTTNATVAEHANRGKGENIKWGLRESAKNGTLGLYDRKCYGYTRDNTGHMVIEPEQADVVRLIFDLYLSGYSNSPFRHVSTNLPFIVYSTAFLLSTKI